MVQIICDRCKREIKDDEEIWNVSIFKENPERRTGSNKFAKWQFCEECKDEIENFTEFKPKEKRKIQKVNHEAIRELKNKGFTYKQISEKLGVGVNTVQNSLQRHKEENPENKESKEQEAISMFLSGIKTDEIAQKLNMDKSEVRKIIAKM